MNEQKKEELANEIKKEELANEIKKALLVGLYTEISRTVDKCMREKGGEE